jgi:hypothetical protein
MKGTYPAEGNPYNNEHRDELITLKYIAEPTYYIEASTPIIVAASRSSA